LRVSKRVDNVSRSRLAHRGEFFRLLGHEADAVADVRGHRLDEIRGRAGLRQFLGELKVRVGVRPRGLCRRSRRPGSRFRRTLSASPRRCCGPSKRPIKSLIKRNRLAPAMRGLLPFNPGHGSFGFSVDAPSRRALKIAGGERRIGAIACRPISNSGEMEHGGVGGDHRGRQSSDREAVAVRVGDRQAG
jgi:hypothetical protein